MITNDKNPAIAIIPYKSWPIFKLWSVSLNELEWPLGRPQRLLEGNLSKLTKDDHLITFPKKPVFFFLRYKVKAKISLMIVEPDVIHNHYIRLSKFFNWRFYKVLTKNKNLINNIKNGRFFYFGSTFLTNIKEINIEKKEMASLIASALNQHQGHKMRHLIVKYIKKHKIKIAVMGRGYKSFERKEDGLKSYKYSIIIENSSENDYFTEKLIDACLLETVPIYWGAPNISDYFDIRGFVICKNIKEIKYAINTMNGKDYSSKKRWIKKNKQTALYHADFKKRAALIIKQSIES
tara:strand:+ start:1832 stop:2710 length:879 start_codon:yes stop_codon:yes gene_type:complete